MPTFVSDFTSILGARGWAADVPNSPTVLTYSFLDEPQSDWPFDGPLDDIDGFQSFTAAQEDTARAALETWASVSGLILVEVAPGEGDLSFGNYELPDGVSGMTIEPLRFASSFFGYELERGGAVRLNSSFMEDTSLSVMLHEVGHALGLEDSDAGEVQLLEEIDTRRVTVMSDNGDPTSQLGVLDHQAIQTLYGAADFMGDDADGLLQFDLDAAALSTTQVWGAQSSEIWGSSLADAIEAGAGDDLVFGFGGDDELIGGAGDDTLTGGRGQDTIIGGVGNDLLSGWLGSGSLLEGGVGLDSLYGSEGNDTLIGGQQADFLLGQAGNDLIYGGDGIDQILGEDGNDTVRAGSGVDRVSGGDGNDLIYGGGNAAGTIENLSGDAGRDSIYGQAGADLLNGGSGQDLLSGGAGSDTLEGSFGLDTLFGGQGNDLLAGQGENDRVNGGAGDDVLFGGHGQDLLFGGSGADQLRGGQGSDRLFGEAGDDQLFGGFGNDRLIGGTGQDLLVGGHGQDVLIGGGGSDTFVFTDAGHVDVIQDFDANDDLERIDLSAVSTITDFDDLVNNHLSQTDTTVHIRSYGPFLNPANLPTDIVLRNVDLDDLDAADFIF